MRPRAELAVLPRMSVMLLLGALAHRVEATVAGPSGAESGALPSEVIVTASRRSESRLDYSGSVSVLDRIEIDRIGATHAVEVLNRAAGVYLQRGSGQESLTAIRSPVLTGAGACGAVLVLEDGMPIRPVGFCNVNEFFELNIAQADRVEIVRGPGSVAFGANAVHGIVNVLTPAVAELAPLRIGADLGTDSLRRLRFETSSGAFGAYGIWSRDPGYRADSGGEEAKLNLLYDREIGEAKLRLRAAGTVLNQETAGFVRGFDAYRDPLLRRSNPNPEAFRDAWSTRLGAEASWRGCEGCAHEVRVVLRRSAMEFLQHFLLGKPLESNAQRSLAFSAGTLRSLRDGWELRAGVDLELSAAELLEVQSGPTTEGSAAARAIRPAGRHYDYTVAGSTLAAYSHLRWRPSERWAAGAALRAERTRYRYDNRMLDGNTDESGQPCGFGGCLFSRPADRTDRFADLSPRLELAYAPAGTQRLYVAAGRGFRPPETTELYRLQRQQRIAHLDSETLENLEAGWIGQWHSLRAAAAAFTMRKRGLVIRDSNGFNISGGRTKHDGIEYELSANLGPRWQLALAGSYARHRYDFDAVIEGGEQIVSGRDVDTAPRTLNNLRLEYAPQAPLVAELELIHVGPYFVDASNARRYPGHILANLRIDWRSAGAWRTSLRLINAFDRRYADRADFAQGDYRYFPGAGRSLVLDVEYAVGAP
jgi:outer membrane receptor protein involved in Fe transport